jgi:hypothetical protein
VFRLNAFLLLLLLLLLLRPIHYAFLRLSPSQNNKRERDGEQSNGLDGEATSTGDMPQLLLTFPQELTGGSSNVVNLNNKVRGVVISFFLFHLQFLVFPSFCLLTD